MSNKKENKSGDKEKKSAKKDDEGGSDEVVVENHMETVLMVGADEYEDGKRKESLTVAFEPKALKPVKEENWEKIKDHPSIKSRIGPDGTGELEVI